MAHSSLVGIDRAAQEPAGRDIATLGLSDISVYRMFHAADLGDADPDAELAHPITSNL